jgi:hypothetical protein
MPAARASASAFAVQAASALVSHGGSASVVVGDHAERLLREATVLLVFGSRPDDQARARGAAGRPHAGVMPGMRASTGSGSGPG